MRTGLVLGLIALGVSAARASLADHYVVPSGSMRPTLVEGDRIVVDKMAFGLRFPFTDRWLVSADGPRRGDVVILASPEDGDTLVKRVMGLPNEVITIRGGMVYANNRVVEALDDPNAATDEPMWVDFGPKVLGDREYLVLGDNRGNSHDGRSFGPVPRETIHGRVEAVVWRHGFTWLEL